MVKATLVDQPIADVFNDVSFMLAHPAALTDPALVDRAIAVTSRFGAYAQTVLEALLWGAVAASSLILGALAGVLRDWNTKLVGLVLGFGAGALVASISFELAEEGFRLAGALAVALGLAAGAIVFYAADRAIDRRAANSASGLALLLGALLDGIPEQAVLGIGIADGHGVSLSLLIAIFVSNLPEAIGSATDMKAGHRGPGRIMLVWTTVAVLCVAATLVGYQLQEIAGAQLRGGINGFAAGALLVMLVGSMIPEATQKAGEKAGLAAVLGFAVAAGLSLAA
ncbi:ZIP family metal transporter [Mycobacterium sp. 2YAF39]|uniref:ZIP family metal transporter n=1 Tax=Mycobacterium sp. 2YAF39 TaxID=3233033 RepID=UPI003F9B43E0